MIQKIATTFRNAKTDEAAQKKLLIYLCGILGWILIVLEYPFGWQMAHYALF